MSISPRFMEELRSRLTLSDIIGRRVRLSHAGREYKGCCPFHNEKTPSFYVNDDKQFYHCFGCGAHGDVVGFVMQHDNLSFIEAIEGLATEAGLQVPQSSPQDIEKSKQEKDLYTLLEVATQWMEAQLRQPDHKEALRYVLNRGISEEELNNFRIGYAPADRQVLRRAMIQKGFTDSQMLEAGLLRPAKSGADPYAFFRERIMFPVMDRRGRVVAFGGRILPDHLRNPDSGDYVPSKYMNSSDTPLFHKGRQLYGEARARQAAAEGHPLIIVEGYVDVIACVRAGYSGAMAPLGTAMTEEQILIVWKMIPQDHKEPILCFDGDEAGRRAAVRACERILPLLKPNQSARIAFLPEGQDPDSLVQGQGAKALSAVLDSALSLVDFIWNTQTTGKAFSTPEVQAGLAQSLENEVVRIVDRTVQIYYQKAFKNKLYQYFNQKNYSKNSKFSSAKEAVIAPMRRPSFSRKKIMDRIFLACLINHPALFPYVEEQFGMLEMEEVRLDALRQKLITTICDYEDVDRKALLQSLTQAGFEAEIQGILSESTYTHAGFVKPQTDFTEVQSGWDNAIKVYQAEKSKKFS